MVFSTQSDVNFALFGNSGPQARAGTKVNGLAARLSNTIEERMLSTGMYDGEREHT